MEEQKESNNRLIIIDADYNLNEPHETEQHVLRYANYRDRAHEMQEFERGGDSPSISVFADLNTAPPELE